LQKFSEEFKEVLHSKLLIIKNVKGLEYLKIPIHPYLCSLSMNTPMGCLVYRPLALVTAKQN